VYWPSLRRRATTKEQPSIQNERQLGTLGRRILKDGDKDDDDIGKLEGIVNEDLP
jgi:hypothetical protein